MIRFDRVIRDDDELIGWLAYSPGTTLTSAGVISSAMPACGLLGFNAEKKNRYGGRRYGRQGSLVQATHMG
jgi:hypothetical protein